MQNLRSKDKAQPDGATLYEVPHFINGKTLSAGKKKLDIYDPNQGKVAGYIQVADADIVNQAITAAKKAFTTWSKTTPVQRTRILFKFKALLDEELENLAKLISKEHGKTVTEAMGSVQRGIDVVDFCCGIPNQLKGSFAENVSTDMDAYSIHQPLGVCVGITPFNFPGMIPLWMFPMAIACGNTFILKASEKDPSCPLRIVELAKKAGVPDGVVNIVQGDKDTVELLISNPEVKAVSFVGSTPVAEHVYKTAIMHGKRAQAFGGAKNHCIVMPDADVEQAAEALVASAYGSAGERCMAISVIVAVGDEVADRLIETMRPKIQKFKVGASHAEDTNMGPLVTKQHWERVQSYIAKGQQEGANLIIDGSQEKPKDLNGFFMGCSLFDHVEPSMQIYKDEIFGPVLSIVRVKDFDTALQLINEHEFGNGTAIFTRDGYIARRFAAEVQVGMVGVNVPIPVPVAYHSFGGWKRSVFADIGMYGSEAVRFYTKLKTVTEKWYP